MPMHELITSKLQQALSPEVLQVENESHMHSGPAAESHFKVTIVSRQFDGERLIQRHRAVNKALADELQMIHALALHTYTPEEYAERGGYAPDSPACEGGSKAS